MSTFSRHHRFREAGEDANVVNVERYGEPKRSLFTSTKVLSFRHEIDITDAREEVVYRASSKVFSLRDKTDVVDAAGKPVAHIEKKVFSLHERHFVTMADGQSFELSNELMHLVKDITNIEGLGWQLRGNVLGLNFELFDENGEIIAVIGQKMFSLHDKYCIDLYRVELEPVVVAILVTLQHMIRDRDAASSGSAAASSSGG